MSLGLATFDILCEAANGLAELRDGCPPGSDAWVVLTELVARLDHDIDAVVRMTALEGTSDAS